jgi:GntR family transcriptional regulator
VPASALYHDIADELREQVAKLHPGDRLPAEAELRRAHGASRFTIRSALQELEREGLIFSAQGRGWFVRDQRPVVWRASAPETNIRTDISPADAWSIGIRAQHREPKEEITVETVVGQEWIRGLLALSRGEHMVIRRRRRYVDGMFSHTDDTAFPEPLVRGTPIALPGDVLPGTYAVMARLGFPWVDPPETTIQARPPSRREAEMFGLGAGVALHEVRRVRRTQEGRVVAVTVKIMPGDRNVIVFN